MHGDCRPAPTPGLDIAGVARRPTAGPAGAATGARRPRRACCGQPGAGRRRAGRGARLDAQRSQPDRRILPRREARRHQRCAGAAQPAQQLRLSRHLGAQRQRNDAGDRGRRGHRDGRHRAAPAWRHRGVGIRARHRRLRYLAAARDGADGVARDHAEHRPGPPGAGNPVLRCRAGGGPVARVAAGHRQRDAFSRRARYGGTGRAGAPAGGDRESGQHRRPVRRQDRHPDRRAHEPAGGHRCARASVAHCA